MTMQLLLIEKIDLHHSESLLSNLKNQGYQVAVAHNFETAAEKSNILWPDLIIFSPLNTVLDISNFQQLVNKIDLNIPCIVVCKENHLVPSTSDMIMLTVSQPQQLIEGIEEAVSSQRDRFIRLSDLVIDCYRRQVLRSDERYSLTPKEFKLLQLLIDNHSQVLSRKEIMQTVWETDYMGDTRTLDVHIRWIREKIEAKPSKPQRLITVRGRGYRFIIEPD